jgi:hypothetical protein
MNGPDLRRTFPVSRKRIVQLCRCLPLAGREREQVFISAVNISQKSLEFA